MPHDRAPCAKTPDDIRYAFMLFTHHNDVEPALRDVLPSSNVIAAQNEWQLTPAVDAVHVATTVMVVDSVNGMRGPKVVERALRRWPGAVVYWLGRDSVPMMDTLPAHLRGSVRTADPFGSDLRALERIAVRADAEGTLQRRREAFVARRALEARGSSGSRRLRAQTLLTLLAHGTPDAILHDLMGYPSSDALNDYRRKTFSFEPRSMTMVELVQLIRQTESMLTRSDAWPDALAVPNRDRRYHRAR